MFEFYKIFKLKVFPNIHYMLSIICSLPISVFSEERSFSTLRRYK